MTVFKLRSELQANGDVRDTLFVGQKGQTLQNAGEIVLRVNEWQMFGTLLLLGAEQVKQHRAKQGHESDVEVMLEGDDEIVRRLS